MKGFITFIFTLTISTFLFAQEMTADNIVGKEVEYRSNGTTMKGYIAYDKSIEGERPGILVVHEWWGLNDYARKRARMLAEEGYIALAVDMYGEGKTAEHPEDAQKFSQAVMSDMDKAKNRFMAGLETLKNHPLTEDDDIAAIGYCFGGGVILNMARLGVNIDGVVSFHGSLAAVKKAGEGDVKAKVLVFQGADDKFVTDEQVQSFKNEMEEAGADYEYIEFENTLHSFTNPEADKYGKKFDLPLAYNEKADKESWNRTMEFFNEIFD